jgi:hypothetical protein
MENEINGRYGHADTARRWSYRHAPSALVSFRLEPKRLSWTLPLCMHIFHEQCIVQWLESDFGAHEMAHPLVVNRSHMSTYRVVYEEQLQRRIDEFLSDSVPRDIDHGEKSEPSTRGAGEMKWNTRRCIPPMVGNAVCSVSSLWTH